MDLIFCIGVSEYIESLDELIIETKRIIRDKGYIIITSSPPCFLNQLRKLMGHRLYLRTQKEMVDCLLKYNYVIVEHNQTRIQDQYLLTYKVIN